MTHPVFETKNQFGSTPPFVIFLLLSAFPLISIGLIGLMVYSAVAAESTPVFFVVYIFVPCMGIALFLLYVGWKFIVIGLAKYRFQDDGLFVKYPLKEGFVITWDAFQEVCVCYAAYTTRGPRRANVVICCVKKGEKQNGYGRWKTDNIFRHKSVITIDYSLELLEGIKEKCPYEVVDLRNTLNYRLDL